MKVDFKIIPGQKVKDQISGLEGVVDHRAIYKNGCKQYSVQPTSDDSTVLKDSWLIDEQQLIVTGTIISTNLSNEVDFKYELGGEAKCLISGVEGVLILAISYINGCIKYRIQPKGKGIKVPESALVDQEDVHIVTIPEKKVKPGPGGPISKASSII